jgi:hypothetical protein
MEDTSVSQWRTCPIGTIKLISTWSADVKLLDVNESKLTPGEKLENYEEAWNEILAGKDGNVDVAGLQEVLEREGELGYVPTELYAREPFRSIARLMDKHQLSTTEVGVFLNWRAKKANLKKARAAKKKPKKKPDPKTFINKFLLAKQGKPIRKDSDL